MKEFDFLQVKDQPDMQLEFKRIAEELFNNYLILKQPDKEYYFTDIEFYFLSPLHQDFFTHAGEEQTEIGNFWHHKSGGIDLTFGDKEKEFWGGILIRGIIAKNNCIPYNGCTDVTKELLKGIKDKNGIIPELTLKKIGVKPDREITIKFEKQRQGLKPEMFNIKRIKFKNATVPTDIKTMIEFFQHKHYRAYF